jgi:hypothetical protein
VANTAVALMREIRELRKSNTALRNALVRHQEALEQTANQLKSGGVTAESVLAGGAPEMRSELTEALDNFETQRHRVRVALFGYLKDEGGTSAAEIGRSLGISRQLASKLAQEADEGS